MRPRLRRAEVADVDFLAEVVFLANCDRYGQRQDWDLELFRSGLREDALDQVGEDGPEHSTTYVIEDNGISVGRLRLVATADQYEIAGLQVVPEHQGRGIGTAVVRSILDLAGRSGLAVSLDVENDNPDAYRLYERLGFVLTEETRSGRRTMRSQ